MTDYLSLALRCEQAVGPSYELDMAIAKAVGLPAIGYGGSFPAFTASIDAAMTLIPKGFHWSLHANSGDQSRARVYDEPGRDDWEQLFAYAATPALALASAALRAMAGREEG